MYANKKRLKLPCLEDLLLPLPAISSALGVTRGDLIARGVLRPECIEVTEPSGDLALARGDIRGEKAVLGDPCWDLDVLGDPCCDLEILGDP